MNTPEQDSGPAFANISELLFAVVKKDKELEVEAKYKLYQKKDVTGYNEAMRQRASLIADLPATVAQYKEKGGVVPEEVEYFAESYAALAGQMLAEDNTFGMSVLLIPRGSTMDDPNDLERIAVRSQPPGEA